MEFYRQVVTRLDVDRLQQRLVIGEMANFCDSIDSVNADEGWHGEIYCLWGQFKVNREEIRDGLRFSLPGCPNALAWTLTIHPKTQENAELRIHCTINQPEQEPDFIESIEQFVYDWQQGLAELV